MRASERVVERVVTAGFAVLKGSRHLVRDAVRLDEHGPVGDRRYCVVDVERARVLRTVDHRSLLAVRVWSANDDGDGDLVVTLPDGRTAAGPAVVGGRQVACEYWGRRVTFDLTDGPHAALLSEHLGRDVALARSPRGGVVYGAPVSLVSTASLRDLGERAGRPDLAADVGSWARFRMTMVVDLGGGQGDEPYAEDHWAGREVDLPGGARILVRRPVPRCGVVDLDPATGAKDGSLLKVLAGYRPSSGGEPWLGVDATVVRPGVVTPT